MDVAILGQAPSRRGDPARPLEGEPLRRRLLELLGCSEEEWVGILKVNALEDYPGPAAGGKGDRFPLLRARARVDRLREDLRGKLVFVLGKHAAAALRVEAPFLARACDLPGGFEFVVVPHPSGVNSWWNDHENRCRAREVCRQAFAQAREAALSHP